MNSHRDIQYLFDLPVEYKDLKLYPVKMEDFYLFSALSSCLMLEKNSITDPELSIRAISMSYLEYLFEMSNEENQLIDLFVGLLSLVLGHKDDKNFSIRYGYGENKKPLFEIKNRVYNSSDFDELRRIIAEQNDVDLPDETIQKSVRDKLEEARRFKEKINRSKVASLEEQIIALSLYTGWKINEIRDMTIRKFFISIKRANHMIMSNIYLTASMSGFVTFKDKSVLRGWLADIDKDGRYGDVSIGLDEIKDKVSGADATK